MHIPALTITSAISMIRNVHSIILLFSLPYKCPRWLDLRVVLFNIAPKDRESIYEHSFSSW
jgi:hypothetical protein